MKTKRQVFILLVVVLAGILTLSAQNRKEQRAEVVRNIISSKNYKIYVDTYIPPYRDPKQLNYLDSIEIKNDSVFSDLLYLEESDIPYSDRGNQLIFQAPIKKYVMDMMKKGMLVSVFQHVRQQTISILKLRYILMEVRTSMSLCNTIKV